LSRRYPYASVLIAAAVFLVCWALLHVWFYAHNAGGDVPLYQEYGQNVRDGQVPYRDFPVEYPPGALPAFVLPALLGQAYTTGFDWLMAACGVGCIAAVAASRPPRWALGFLAVSPLIVGTLIRSHYDLWPALLLATAVAALLNDRHRLGWALLAAAVSAKLYAAVVVPLAVVWALRRRGRGELARSLAVGAAVLAVVFVPFAVLGPHELRSTIEGQISRPLQIETLAASYLMTFEHPEIKSSHGSKSLINHDGLAAATSGVLLALLIALWIGFARGPTESERFARYVAACVCAFVAFGKILSPQFLIWLVPVVPLVHGRRGIAAAALFVVAAVNTLFWFPGRYFTEYVYVPHLAWLVLLRNLTLVAAFVVLAVPARPLRDSSPVRMPATRNPDADLMNP
jgi:uncharacterized membrane protein